MHRECPPRRRSILRPAFQSLPRQTIGRVRGNNDRFRWQGCGRLSGCEAGLGSEGNASCLACLCRRRESFCATARRKPRRAHRYVPTRPHRATCHCRPGSGPPRCLRVPGRSVVDYRPGTRLCLRARGANEPNSRSHRHITFLGFSGSDKSKAHLTGVFLPPQFANRPRIATLLSFRLVDVNAFSRRSRHVFNVKNVLLIAESGRIRCGNGGETPAWEFRLVAGRAHA